MSTVHLPAPSARRQDRHIWALGLAAAAPLAAAAALLPLRPRLPHADVAMALVLVVVVACAAGSRAAGLLATASGAAAFILFATQTHPGSTLDRAAAVVTTALLLLTGAAVAGLVAERARRAPSISAPVAPGEAAIDADVVVAASGTDSVSPSRRIEQVQHELTALLGLDRCTYDYGAGIVGGARYRLRPDGEVVRSGAVLDVDHDGLPTDADIDLPVTSLNRYHGRFRLHARAGAHPSPTQRVIAGILAAQVATHLDAAVRASRS